ncbi:MAG: MinD/ParA family protein [Lachnospiraceae bacterium]|nr:MinD/ParA family protein [Lachnospiraceae bacterium]
MDQAENLRNVIKAKNQHNITAARVITITSGKGGVGKSNLAVNLAVHFRKMGKRVIIFDADFGLANVGVMFGTISKYTLKDVVYGGRRISEIITTGPMDIGFVSGGSGIVELNNLDKVQLKEVIRSLSELNELCDILIIDTGAGVSDAVLDFVVSSPEVLLVSTPEPSSITDSYSLIKALYAHPLFVSGTLDIKLIANKVSSEAEGRAIYDKLSSVVGKFLGGELKYLGIIPSDQALEKSVRNQQVVSIEQPLSKSARAIESIAKTLMGKDDMGSTTNRWGISHIFSSFGKNRGQI